MIYVPTLQQVPDQYLTGEVWVLNTCEPKFLKQIKILESKTKLIPCIINNKIDKMWDWDYEYISLNFNIFKEFKNFKNFKRLYFISENKVKTLIPRVPQNSFTKSGIEDNKIPRICFSTSIYGCLKGISKDLTNKTLNVYYIDI